MSDTPKTDAVMNMEESDPWERATALLEHARQLERELNAVKALLEGAQERLAELNAVKAEHCRMMASHGMFLSDLTYAAFGHRDALTNEQIIESLKQLREGNRP